MKTPTLFGFPLWVGKIKRRVAKKFLRRYRSDWFLKARTQKAFGKLAVGSYINDCSGFNGKILSMQPNYRRVGKGRGSVLLDIDFQTDNTGCSLRGCGVEPGLSQEEVEKRTVDHLKGWTLAGGGATWFGADTEEYRQAVERAQRIIRTVESGGHITDEFGRCLPEYARTI